MQNSIGCPTARYHLVNRFQRQFIQMSTILMALGSWSFVRDPICRISYSLWLAKRPLKLFFLPIQHSIEIYITSKIFTYACVYMSFAKRTFCDGQNDGTGWGMWLCGGESRVEHTNTFLYVCLAQVFTWQKRSRGWASDCGSLEVTIIKAGRRETKLMFPAAVATYIYGRKLYCHIGNFIVRYTYILADMLGTLSKLVYPAYPFHTTLVELPLHN